MRMCFTDHYYPLFVVFWFLLFGSWTHLPLDVASEGAIATGLIGADKPFMSLANSSRLSDCAPSDKDRSGQGCTSIIKPSAPMARAARLAGAISSRLPVPCDGSA